MKLSKLTKEELESMSYDDIAYKVLEEEKKKMKLPELFKKICDLLELDEVEYEARIGDFFQLISRDQRFTMIEDGYWDLKEKYKAQIILNEEENEEEQSEDDTDMSEETEDDDETTYYDEDSEDDDVEEDDLKDLVIVSDDEDDEANL